MVEAIGIAGGTVAQVGTLADVRAASPSGTPIIEAGLVVPAFVDSHIHALWLGRARSRVTLRGSPDIPHALARLRAAAQSLAPGEWLLGDAEIDGAELAEGRLPTIDELDEAALGHPLLLDRRSHDALANRAALAAAGALDRSENATAVGDPTDGRIERDSTGRPTGLLIERAAVAIVERVVPPPGEASLRRWIREAHQALRSVGTTTAADPALSPVEIAAYVAAAADGLSVRSVLFPLGGNGIDPRRLHADAESTGIAACDPRTLRLGAVKLFLDGGGSLGTALRHEPWPSTELAGIQSTETETLIEYLEWSKSTGQPLAVHAVGPRAVELLVQTAAFVSDTWPLGQLHLIHAYLEQDDAVMRRAAGLGIAAAIQPALHRAVRGAVKRRIGRVAADGLGDVRRWLDSGALVGGGSDAPGPDHDPLPYIAELVPLIGAERALRLFTADAARLIGSPTGRLVIGAPADILELELAHIEELASGTAMRLLAGP
ncbi:amidohydrolase family protein [Lacisediminihabitans profunda]|uniref:amidohydrolase family protein n=1 Tax=Lacisediminihabitans profunda TaxID=2594790 RepID=UPI00164FE01F|nr:amidohydrolase family protein [Lacisediminihabitans profunda]